MKVDEMERLLTAFYEGKTTEQEEIALKQALLREDVPTHLLEERKLFLDCFAQSEAEDMEPLVPISLEEKLTAWIDAKQQVEKHPRHAGNRRLNLKWVSGIAASILLVGVFLAMGDYFDRGEKKHKDTFTNPEEAYQVLRATLIEVSEGLNQGLALWCEVQQDVEENNLEIRSLINKQ